MPWELTQNQNYNIIKIIIIRHIFFLQTFVKQSVLVHHICNVLTLFIGLCCFILWCRNAKVHSFQSSRDRRGEVYSTFGWMYSSLDIN
jgi:hypothetical protein